jgi:hypothetical protein
MTTYIVQKKVVADSVQEALNKEPETAVTSVFPDTSPKEHGSADAIGFKHVPARVSRPRVQGDDSEF